MIKWADSFTGYTFYQRRGWSNIWPNVDNVILHSISIWRYAIYYAILTWRQWRCNSYSWASCQIQKLTGCACVGVPGTFSPPPRVSDPDMHHGTCVTHVPWCMPGSLTSGFLWSRWWGKRSRHSRRMRKPQFYVSGKRPIRLWIVVSKGTNILGPIPISNRNAAIWW